MKSLIWAGCVALIMGALAFAACENKGKDGEVGDLIGTWKSVPGYAVYQEQLYILTFKADNTGTFRFIGEIMEEISGFTFTYTFDEKANIGVMYPESEYYGEKDGTEFKLVWKSKDQVEVYVREYQGKYEEWEPMGLFTRQKDVKDVSIEGTWKYNIEDKIITTLAFNANGTCTYTYQYFEETTVMNGTYTYNVSTCFGEMSLTSPEYPDQPFLLRFKVDWMNEEAAYVYYEDNYYGPTDWYYLGYFVRL